MRHSPGAPGLTTGKAPRPIRLLALVGLALLACGVMLPGCKSTPDALKAEKGLIRDVTPVAYRIAVAPFDVAADIPEPSEDHRWYLSTRDAEELQALLVAALREQNTGTEVVALDQDPRSPSLGASTDLVLVPHLRRAYFEKDGASGRVWASSVLWLFTWIGSLWVEDAEYAVDMALECELIDPHTQDEVAGRLTLEPGNVELRYWDRNEAWTGGFFMTMVFVPFWAKDKAEIVSPSLTSRTMQQLAGRIKRYLVESHGDEVARGRYAQVSFESPRNGSSASGTVDLSCTVETREGVERLLLYRNGENVDLRSLPSASEVPDLENQMDPRGSFEFQFRATGIPLDPGPNYLRLWLQLGSGDVTTRSIVVHAGGAQ